MGVLNVNFFNHGLLNSKPFNAKDKSFYFSAKVKYTLFYKNIAYGSS
jgi:hypothetical protein